MFRLTVKRYLHHYENDNRYVIEQVDCFDHQLGNWLANPKTWSYELIRYEHL